MNKVFFMCGLPASGKSTWADVNKEKLNAVIHSSDNIRLEFGDVNDQSQNELVFNTLHKRIKEDLLNGKNVIYDATNLSRKRRIHFLSNELKYVPCKKICVLFATPYEICQKNNAAMDRKVPEHVLERMIKNFETPCLQEGWDDIQIVWYDYNKYGLEFDYAKDLCEWTKISHDNIHHTLSIGDHMLAAYGHYVTDVGNLSVNNLLATAILLHDCGKIDVKDYHDKDGNSTNSAKYYNHHNVSAYKSLFYLNDLRKIQYDWNDKDIIYVALLIELHMRPFLAWDNSIKSKEKDRRLFGDDVIANIELIHECDLAAH